MSLQESVSSPRSTRNGGSFAAGPEENFRNELLGDVCRVIWPDKPDQQIAFIVGCTDRAARDYLKGKVAAPSVLIAAIIVAITKRN